MLDIRYQSRAFSLISSRRFFLISYNFWERSTYTLCGLKRRFVSSHKVLSSSLQYFWISITFGDSYTHFPFKNTGIIISRDHRRTVIRCFFPNKYCSTCHFYYLLSSVLSILPRHKKFCLFLTPFRHHPSPQQCRQNSFSGFPRARYLLYHHKNLPEDSVRLPRVSI